MGERLKGDRAEALDRLGAKFSELPDDEKAIYLLLCMTVIAKHAPEVLHFVLDRVDENLTAADEAS